MPALAHWTSPPGTSLCDYVHLTGISPCNRIQSFSVQTHPIPMNMNRTITDGDMHHPTLRCKEVKRKRINIADRHQERLAKRSSVIRRELPSMKQMIKNGIVICSKIRIYQIIKQDSMTPSSRKNVMITVIYKKGDPTKPENYRPICTLPVLYKLFSMMVHNRPYAKLDSYQFPVQAGFRKQIRSTNHLHDVQTCWPKKQTKEN